ncbi:unnamed protein product [Blepharisma stoltei]|uniref:Uncharacterized protein n=1 Tax=Blepharisma stoltei TaxID=1481888 RepID=A0AAU9J528_9CILI|nr:unnamed protein product [Blepharisma stoltei]
MKSLAVVAKETKAELEADYSNYLLEADKHEKVSFTDQLKLKRILNKLIASNVEKEAKLTKLKSEVDNRSWNSINSYHSGKNMFITTYSDSISVRSASSTFSIIPSKDDVLEQLKKIEEMSEDAEQEKIRVEALLAKEKKTNLIWQERIQHLNEAHHRVTKSHTASILSKRKAISNLILGQKETMIFEQEMQKRRHEFSSQFNQKKQKLEEVKEEIEKLIERISFNLMKWTDQKTLRDNYMQALESQIEKYEVEKEEKRVLENTYKSYKENMRIINEIMERHEKPQCQQLTYETADHLAGMYKFFIYQDASLSSRFQELTYEFLERQQELANLDGNLHELVKENDNILLAEINVTETYNQLKSSLEDMKILTSLTEDVAESEDNLLRFYLLMLNLSITSFKHIKNMNSSSDAITFTKERAFINAYEIIEELQKGFWRKRNNENTSKNPPKEEANAYIEIPENSPEGMSMKRFTKEVLPYMSLRITHFIDCLGNFIDDEAEKKRIGKLLKKQPFISYFVDVKSLEEFFKLKKDTIIDPFLIICNLTELGHSKFQRQLGKLFNSLTFLYTRLKSNLNELNYSYSESSFQDEKLFTRKPNRIPTLIKEKFKSKAVPSEQDIDLIPIYKPAEMTKSQSKLEVKLTDEEAALKRMKNFMPVQLSNIEKDKLNESEDADTRNSSKANTKKNSIIFESLSPQEILNEVKGIDRKISNIRYSERKAGNRLKSSLQEAPLLFKQYNKPWNSISARGMSREELSKEPTRPSTFYRSPRNLLKSS